MSYLKAGRVRLVSEGPRRIELAVEGTYVYEVAVTVSRGQFHFSCTCPYSGSGRFCKHMIASVLFLNRHVRKNSENSWKETLDSALREIELSPPGRSRPYFLCFSLSHQYGVWSVLPYTLDVSKVLELAGSSPEIISSQAIIDLIQQNSWLGAQARRVQQALSPADCVNCSPGVVAAANMIRRSEGGGTGYYYYAYTRPVEDYLALLAGTGTPVFVADSLNPLHTPIRLWAAPGEVKISIEKTDDGDVQLTTRVELPEKSIQLQPGGIQKITTDPLWVRTNGDVFRIPADRTTGALAVFLDQPQVLIPQERETEFLEHYLLPIAESVRVEGGEIRWEVIQAPPVKRLYLSEEGGELAVRLKFGYQDVEVPYEAGTPRQTIRHKQDGTWTLLRINRDPAREEAIYRSISGARSGLKYCPDRSDNAFCLRAGVDVVDFLLKKVPALAEDGFEIYGEDTLTAVRVNRSKPTLSLNVSSGIDWFDLTAVVRFGDVEVSLKEVQRALRKKKRYVRLADGAIGEIPEEWVARYRHLFGLGEQTDAGLRLSKFHATLVDELLAKADNGSGDREFRRRVKALKEFSGVEPVGLPEGFRGDLRPYQKAGYDWLHFLKCYGFGGILADDMGLGKTVQVLVFLQSLVEQGMHGQASLVVLPRSLLFNWQREAQTFTPGLRILEHFGPQRTRSTRDFRNYDVVLTTYGTMRRDIQLLRGYEFAYAILDESQAIKNPLAQVSKAARLLNASHKLAMTGTPVENSTFELWSQFAFLNPGLLGGFEYFKREFAGPIERASDEEAAAVLRRLVHPFILRRTKSQVAPELPPRTERVVYGEMEPAQKKLYERTRDAYRSLVMGMLAEQGMADTRMKILEGLLRLRQISNHPQLVDPDFRGGSAKLELLLEQLETLEAEGHKALVFSQFVQMLKVIRKELDARRLPYVYLDGQTHDRQARVDRFQDDPAIPFFLISLRAGGVGLNLTAADYVIHVDPWWNPAVEMQAADRTHRIGQDKPVFVYKLIMRDTVEEKILQLQEKKKALVDQLITTEAGFFKQLDPDDVRALFS